MSKYLVIAAIMIVSTAITGCTGNPSKEGVELLKDGQYKEAEEIFEKAIEKEVNIGDAYRGIGLAKWEQKEYEEAAAAFNKAIKNGTEKNGTIYNLLGNCQLKLKEPEMALNYYRLALEAEGNSDALVQEVEFNVIAAHEQLKDWESAKAKLKEYLTAYPDDAQAQKEAEFLETR